MLAPDTEAGLAAAITDAHAAGEPILVQGAATKLGMLRPVQAARSLSTSALCGTTLYAPNELVVSARSGTKITELAAMLAEHNQQLIAEPPDYAALLGTEPGAQTLGGVTATNLSGPRRITWGAMRDHVLGMRVIDGTGALTRAGGRVLKNVTGLDICKLVTGSHGTLGVMSEITLKVLPAAEASGSLVVSGLDATGAVAFLSAALGSPYGVSGAAYLPDAAASLVGLPAPAAIIRIEDFAASVTYRLSRLRTALDHFGPIDTLDDPTSRRTWSAIRDAFVLVADPADAVWRASIRPSRGPAILAAATQMGARGYLDWGGGLAMLAGPATEAAHLAITAAITAAGGVWTLMRAPEPLRAAVAVVPAEPAALQAITRRVKATMDPRGILNPGRVFAGV